MFLVTLTPEPYPIGKIDPRFIQMFVVVDYSMLKYYGEQNVEKFTLTLMNIVSKSYVSFC